MTYTMTSDEASIYSDMYKDANGFRPRHICRDFFDRADFEREMEYLQLQVEEAIAQESAREAGYYDQWIAGVHNTAVQTGNRVATVVRWLFDAENLRLSCRQDREMFCFQNGFDSMQSRIEKIR